MKVPIESLLRQARLLIVEDSDSLRSLYEAYMETQPWHTETVGSAAEAALSIETVVPTLIVLDLQLPDADDLEFLSLLRDQAPDIGVVVATGHGSVGLAVEALRLGALDFLEKPVARDRLVRTVRNALERLVLERQVQSLMGGALQSFHGFIGGSLAMQAVYRTIEAAAPSRATVFITGESGTGKEVCARAIHAQSSRTEQAFVALNCAAIPRELMESELFGHQKGAFTGAAQARIGAVESADRGTLFLDEICEMSLDLQTKLLRLLQTGVVKRLGSNSESTVDIRVLCATNRDPWVEVEAGRFREDLYFRLHVIPLHLPPLREREDDVLLLAERFLARFAKEEGKRFEGLSERARAALQAHPWPGNVRELENVIRHAVVLNKDGWIDVAHLALDPRRWSRLQEASTAKAVLPIAGAAALKRAAHDHEPPAERASIRPLAQVERDAIEQAIQHCAGNVPEAARHLDVAPSTLYRKLAQWSRP